MRLLFASVLSALFALVLFGVRAPGQEPVPPLPAPSPASKSAKIETNIRPDKSRLVSINAVFDPAGVTVYATGTNPSGFRSMTVRANGVNKLVCPGLPDFGAIFCQWYWPRAEMRVGLNANTLRANAIFKTGCRYTSTSVLGCETDHAEVLVTQP